MNIPILMYHMIKNTLNGKERRIHVSKVTFEKHLRTLAKKGFTSISLQELYNAFKGQRSLPYKPIIITFDDGYLDNFELAFSILRKYSFTATIFLPTNLIDNNKNNLFNGRHLMSWNEIKTMHENGISFASHTATHPHLTQLSDEEILEELSRSKEVMEKRFGQKCHFIAYPYGDFNSRVRELTEKAGYKAACSVEIGLNRPGNDMFALKRISIIDLDHPAKFLRKATFGYWDPPWSIVPRYYFRRVRERIGI